MDDGQLRSILGEISCTAHRVLRLDDCCSMHSSSTDSLCSASKRRLTAVILGNLRKPPSQHNDNSDTDDEPLLNQVVENDQRMIPWSLDSKVRWLHAGFSTARRRHCGGICRGRYSHNCDIHDAVDNCGCGYAITMV